MDRSAAVNTALNQQVANFGVMYIKLHNFHWYVKGSQFFTLHVKFEELYNEITLHLDALAERMLTLGGKPVATMQQMLKDSAIKEAAGNEKAEDMVRAIVEDFKTISGQLQEGMDLAEKAGDETTGDLFLAIQGSLDKHTWMLNSFLG
ncbi:DNA starvation/stationary phase protection protein [Paenibacillus piri]|uniref:DNA starvation/stationary phase protection protein n=2 Tax=Paenibacillus piri TaxID=2547395 RepID=A0A4R5KIF1_9BACL|nr:DNA starvation/stationary phase protection protein [Paenibacillus piri]